MSDKYKERVVNAITSILVNYAAIAFGIGVFNNNIHGFISGGATVLCILWVAALHKD